MFGQGDVHVRICGWCVYLDRSHLTDSEVSDSNSSVRNHQPFHEQSKKRIRKSHDHNYTHQLKIGSTGRSTIQPLGAGKVMPPMSFAEGSRAVFPRLAVGTTVVSVCRAMLSIRSLAATYHVDPAWILNHAELSRVQWRRGASEGEIYVEVDELDGLPQSH